MSDINGSLFADIDDAIDALASQDAEEQIAAMEYLRAAGPRAHTPVLHALADYRSSQPNLARLLGEFGRPDSVPILVAAARRGDHPLRFAAVSALSEHRGPVAADALATLTTEPDDPVLAELASRVLADRDASD